MYPKSTTYHAYESIPVITTGYQLQLPGLSIVVPRLFIGGGSVLVEQAAPDQTGNIDLTKQADNELTFSVSGLGRVNNYGSGGVCVEQFSFYIVSGRLTLAAGGIQSQSLDNFVDAVIDKMYGFATGQFSSALIEKLNHKLGLTLPPIENWRMVTNETPYVVSFAPNALTRKEATQQAELPQTFTIAAWQSADTQHYIVVKGQSHRHKIKAFVELIKTDTFNLQSKTLITIDISEQLPDYLPYFYIQYWENRFNAEDKSHIKHLHMAPTPEFNSLILDSAVDEAGILFNGAFENNYIDNKITPFAMQMGILPKDECIVSDEESE